MENSQQGAGLVTTSRVAKIAIAALLVGFVAAVVANAWLSDDAYITFRTVDNFVHGYGLTWNVRERVQAYTHPLWMLLLAGFYGVTGEAFYTSLLLSIGISVAAVALLASRGARSGVMAAFAVAVLAVSKAFVDYSTSGLENPLTHLILVVFLLTFVRGHASPRWIFRLSLLAALGATNRLDVGLLFAPVLVWAFFEVPSRRSVVAALLGFLPLLVWELFSLLYYGTPFPNTALAKLNAGLIRPADVWREGLLYLQNSLRVDPVTLVCIGTAMAVPFAAGDRRRLPMAAGIALYLVYVVRVGGDFMSGRFLTAPLLQAVTLIVAAPWALQRRERHGAALALLAVFLAVGLAAPYCPIRASGSHSADRDPRIWVKGRSITDERANYYQNAGLLVALRERGEMPSHDWAREGKQARSGGPQVVVKGSVGFFGYFAGPQVHVVDLLALGDPLLARLPVTDPNWQIGHFGRRLPEGYLETLETGENHIGDAGLAAYYESLTTITRGELFGRERLREIWRLNTGAYDSLLESYAYWRNDAFVRAFEVVNPTDAPYVYAYVWNNGAGETYLLDDTSVAGRVYPIEWSVSPDGVTFRGEAVRQVASIGALSDAELLNIGVFFAQDPSLESYAMYEYRYWFRLGDAPPTVTVVLPGLGWYNGAAPGGFWEERAISHVMRRCP